MRRCILYWGAALGMLVLAGCASDRGGTDDTYYSGLSTSRGVTAPPTMRPGMNSQDIRDPNFFNNQQPVTRATP